ncbi:MAG: OB-fold domain-containing protein [Pseudomonadota bacterium]
MNHDGAPARDESEKPGLTPSGLVRLVEDPDAAEGKKWTLLGGLCPDCQKEYYPRPRFCPRCLKETVSADLGDRGTVYSYTVVRIKPPLGLPQPYGLGLVDLAGKNLRVFGLLDPAAVDSLFIGRPVRLAVAPLGRDRQGTPCLRPYFTPDPGLEQGGPTS